MGSCYDKWLTFPGVTWMLFVDWNTIMNGRRFTKDLPNMDEAFTFTIIDGGNA